MSKINQEEYEVLKKVLSDGYEWIARDRHNPLCTHRHKPVKQDHWIQQYQGIGGNGYKEIDDNLFQFIQWEDEEPYNIQELIEEYESEETEVKELKNLKEVKETIESEIIRYERYPDDDGAGHRIIALTYVLGLLDQLDEPEVLSQEWIDEHGRVGHFQHGGGNDFDYFVKVKDLQNLLVPKQGESTSQAPS